MSHRKIYSQGSIPFSWEDSPGVSKFIHTVDIGQNAVVNLSSPILFPRDSGTSDKVISGSHGMKIPLPPCASANMEPPRRSKSMKGFRWWQEDPFLAAFKECTKNARNGRLSGESKKQRKSRLIFSCKSSCDVQDDNLVKLADLPAIPRDRVR
ncbi:T22J18.15-RELATED [Salix viminalis]|uniref:T22J18.15-RELATED n=1 Tax=Salix viminalis TaxID=40686 RepID=A0A9Q0NZV0_SALVM|nr:T22J18.15-RELATED [Salix viminalis]